LVKILDIKPKNSIQEIIEIKINEIINIKLNEYIRNNNISKDMEVIILFLNSDFIK
jgi:hypothetical protein